MLQRLFDRFKDDKLATSENYTKRLLNMLNVEPEEWIKPALTGQQPYDLIVELFNNNNNEVMDTIIQKFTELQCEKKRKLK